MLTTTVHCATVILVGLSLVGIGYGIASAGKVSAAWLLHNDCHAVAFAKSEIMSGDMVFVHEGQPGYLCEGGVLK